MPQTQSAGSQPLVLLPARVTPDEKDLLVHAAILFNIPLARLCRAMLRYALPLIDGMLGEVESADMTREQAHSLFITRFPE